MQTLNSTEFSIVIDPGQSSKVLLPGDDPGGKALASRGRRDIFAWLRDVDQIVMTRLPAFNRAATAERERVRTLIACVDPLLTASELLELGRRQYVDPRLAREVIGMTAWLAASVDTHLQRLGKEAGEGYRIFAGLEETLIALGRLGQHPPVHSHLTYWVYNDFPLPRTFTGTAGEVHFNRAVNGVDRAKAFICQQIAPIAEGELDLNDPDAKVRIERADGAYGTIRQLFMEYRRPEAEGCPMRMPQKAFLTGMRPFLVNTKIGGKTYTGANAANVHSWIESDFRIGFAQPFYVDMVRGRYPTMMPEEPPIVEAFMARGSVCGVVARRLGLTVESLASSEITELVGRCADLPQSARAAIKAFGRLAKSARTTSAIHFGFIQHYVEQAGKLLDPDEQCVALVCAGKGVSGMAIADGAALVDAMRKENPSITKLIDLAKVL